MTDVTCRNCGDLWMKPTARDGTTWQCTNCKKQITVAARDITSDIDEDSEFYEEPLDELEVEEEVRREVRESRNAIWAVEAAVVAWFVVAVKLSLSPIIVWFILWPPAVAWLAIGGLLVYWYRRSRSGDFESQLAAFHHRRKLAPQQRAATATPRYLVGGGFAVALAVSSVARGLRFSGADDGPMMMFAVVVMGAAFVAILVGIVWMFPVYFKTLRVAGLSRVYAMFSFFAVVIGLFQ